MESNGDEVFLGVLKAPRLWVLGLEHGRRKGIPYLKKIRFCCPDIGGLLNNRILLSLFCLKHVGIYVIAHAINILILHNTFHLCAGVCDNNVLLNLFCNANFAYLWGFTASLIPKRLRNNNN